MNFNNTNIISSKLRELTVQEWISHPEEYQPFLGVDHSLSYEASKFLHDGYFSSELGNSMPLAMANVLNIPLVLITQMESMSVLPITPRVTLHCQPIFVAYDHTGEGHYDAVEHIKITPELIESQPCPNSSNTFFPGSCRCGQGATKKEVNIISCDNVKKRCKCFQGVKACSAKCQCLGC